MNEDNISGVEQTADQPDAFMEGWDDEAPALDAPADQPEGGAEAQTQGAEPADQPGDAAGADNAGVQDAGETPPDANAGQPLEIPAGQDAAADSLAAEAKPQSWTLKHLDDQAVTISADDVRVPELLQKGLDYDRVREKYDAAKPVLELMGALAKSSGMETAAYIQFIRAEAKRATGMSEDEAKRAVELEDREAAVSAKEAADKEATEAKAAATAKIQSDLAEFGRAFPAVYEQAKSDPKIIPPSVWADVNRGLSLTAAYSRYAVAQAEAKAAGAEQRAATNAANAKNAARSTGSMASAGNDAKNSDPFLEGWDS